jgi:hypothetical protein
MDKKTLERLFLVREQTFQRATEDILKALGAVINGVAAFLHLKEELAQGKLTWQNVQMQDDVVLLIGIIEYPPGAKFITSQGEQMVVSKENKDYFKRILRIGLPISLVENGTAEDVVRFMSNADKDAEEITETVEVPEELANISDFNLDDLTDAQKSALLIKENDKAVH